LGGFIPDLANDVDRFRMACSSSVSATPAHANLESLRERFRYDDSIQRVWEHYVTGREASCKGATILLCSNVYAVRGTWVIAYPTKGCEVRRVTVDDVRRDVRSWTYATEAEKAVHLTLADKIEACRAAQQAGYTWEHQEPTESRDCRKQ
jgi:hypothetical protein